MTMVMARLTTVESQMCGEIGVFCSAVSVVVL